MPHSSEGAHERLATLRHLGLLQSMTAFSVASCKQCDVRKHDPSHRSTQTAEPPWNFMQISALLQMMGIRRHVPPFVMKGSSCALLAMLHQATSRQPHADLTRALLSSILTSTHQNKTSSPLSEATPAPSSTFSRGDSAHILFTLPMHGTSKAVASSLDWTTNKFASLSV